MANEENDVKVTTCETRSQSRIVHTRHGTVKVVESVPVKKGKGKR